MVSFDVSVSFDLREIKRNLDDIDFGARENTKAVLTAVANETYLDALRLLVQKRHLIHTKTPSAPGEPPAAVSGALGASLRASAAAATGPASWEATVSPLIVYSRIQEMGGISGKGHRTHLPARPYLRRALDDKIAEGYYRDEFLYTWSHVVSRG